MPTYVHHLRNLALRAEMVALRKKSGLSQFQLAQALGVGQSYVSKVERGDMYVDLSLSIDWCRACGATPENVIAQLN